MGYLARAGFDVFSMDMTGYGRSTRPAAMNDPCNLSREQQASFLPPLVPSTCSPSYPHQLTTIASDWNDINEVVDHVRALRHVDRVGLVAWSLGGPRAGGYAAQHPEKVSRLVLSGSRLQSRDEGGCSCTASSGWRGDDYAVARRSSRRTGTGRWDVLVNMTGRPAIRSGR